MLTALSIRRFKRFRDVRIDLGNPVLFIGPNDSGKTSALQALTLWYLGLRKWEERRGDEKINPKKRVGVTINRRDLMSIPIPTSKLLWNNLQTHYSTQEAGKQKTKQVFIDVIVEGFTEGIHWEYGFEFYYNNEESFYCRPIQNKPEKTKIDTASIHELTKQIQVAFLPPMSGLSDQEFLKQPGEISFLIGQGRTAEVLRNQCLSLKNRNSGQWDSVKRQIKDLFGIVLDDPIYSPDRSEITLSYLDRYGTHLDISSSGRGLQQTLLLVVFMALNPNSVVMLDEPDAHLEILRQRSIYKFLVDSAYTYKSQIIVASHSEVLLEEASGRDTVVAFLGQPHRIDDQGFQLTKALKNISSDHYYQAELTGWILYLEGSTDLAILRTFADTLDHPVKEVLASPFVHYTGNQPAKARDHYYGLREAKKDLFGIAIFDRIDKELSASGNLFEYMWKKREIENYFCTKKVLLRWVEKEVGELLLLFDDWRIKMEDCINELESALNTFEKSPWSPDLKVTDDFLDPLFRKFYKKISDQSFVSKTNYYHLTRFVKKEEIDPEIIYVLNLILETAKKANPSEQ